MRWLLQRLLEDLQRLLHPRTPDLARLRDGMLRGRHRHAYHRQQAREASDRFADLRGRIRVLELSPEAPLAELVDARRDLMAAEGDFRHHRVRTAEVEEALRLMRDDRRTLEAGGDPRHLDQYAHLL